MFDLSIKDEFCGPYRTMPIQFTTETGQPLHNSQVTGKQQKQVNFFKCIQINIKLHTNYLIYTDPLKIKAFMKPSK